MGSVLGTAGLSIVATLAFVVAAILIMVADSRLKSISGYNNNDDLKKGHSDLITGYILAWIAAGISFILMLGYLFKSFHKWLPEWLHMILLVLALVLAIIALVYMGLGMRKIDNTPNDNGTQGYVLWGMILTGVGLVILILLAMWRITHWGSDNEKDMTDKQGSYQDQNYGYQSGYDQTTVVIGGMPPPPNQRPESNYYR